MKLMQEMKVQEYDTPRRYFKLPQSTQASGVQRDLCFDGGFYWLEYRGEEQIRSEASNFPVFDEEEIVLPDGRGSVSSPEELVDRLYKLLKRVVVLPCETDFYFTALYSFATWVYDLHPFVSYLAFIGLSGAGKSEALSALEQLVFCGVRISGADTEATIFRNIDRYRGTLLIDESQVDSTNSASRFHKILTEGFQHKGSVSIAVQRNETGRDKEHRPRRYSVFGVKVFSGLWLPNHEAIVNRTYEIRIVEAEASALPKEKTTDDSWLRDARQLRNDMLLHRQKRLAGEIAPMYNVAEVREMMEGLNLVGRERQVFGWLYSECPSKSLLDKLSDAVLSRRSRLSEERSMSLDVQVLLTAHRLHNKEVPVSVKDIVADLKNYDGPIHNKKVASILRAHGFRLGRNSDGTTLEVPKSDIAWALSRQGIKVES